MSRCADVSTPKGASAFPTGTYEHLREHHTPGIFKKRLSRRFYSLPTDFPSISTAGSVQAVLGNWASILKFRMTVQEERIAVAEHLSNNVTSN